MTKRTRDAALLGFSPSTDRFTAPNGESTTDTIGNAVCQHSGADVDEPVSKQTHVDDRTTEPSALTMPQCSLAPHKETLTFASLEEFETHYSKVHTNRCASCDKNFPSGHYLHLHIQEYHDPFREALQARGEKTYACFVEDCERKCSTPEKRRLHLIDKHAFPRPYNFQIVRDGIDKRLSMLRQPRRRRISSTTLSSNPPNTDQTPMAGRPSSNSLLGRRDGVLEDPGSASVPTSQSPRHTAAKAKPLTNTKISPSPAFHDDEAINDLSKFMSALQFVPRNVRLKDPTR